MLNNLHNVHNNLLTKQAGVAGKFIKALIPFGEATAKAGGKSGFGSNILKGIERGLDGSTAINKGIGRNIGYAIGKNPWKSVGAAALGVDSVFSTKNAISDKINADYEIQRKGNFVPALRGNNVMNYIPGLRHIAGDNIDKLRDSSGQLSNIQQQLKAEGIPLLNNLDDLTWMKQQGMTPETLSKYGPQIAANLKTNLKPALDNQLFNSEGGGIMNYLQYLLSKYLGIGGNYYQQQQQKAFTPDIARNAFTKSLSQLK